jgi:hypothetical protein
VTWPVPTIAELANYTGRPVESYTGYANSALLQATMMFTILSENSVADYAGMNADFRQLANMGVMAMADWLYLRWPYQQVMASPLQSEEIGSYSYSKPIQEMARNAQAIEVTSEKTGVDMFDLAVRRLAKRQSLDGVYFGQITGFEHYAKDDLAYVKWDPHEGRMVLVGPADRDQLDLQFFDVNAQSFPMDPGLLQVAICLLTSYS